VAILVPGFDGIYLLRVPPNSLKLLREYTLRFKGSGTSISDVITRIKLEKKTLQFSGVSYIDQATAQKRNEARAKNLTADIVGINDQPIAGALAAPAPQAQLAPSIPVQPSFQPAPMAATPLAASSPAPVPQSPPTGRGRGRGRPRSTNGPEAQAAQQPAQQAQAPFPTQPAPQFGISQGQAPGADLNAALDSFFGPAPQK
jgi:hypothetical protein